MLTQFGCVARPNLRDELNDLTGKAFRDDLDGNVGSQGVFFTRLEQNRLDDVLHRYELACAPGTIRVRLQQFSGHRSRELTLINRGVKYCPCGALEYLQSRGSRLEKSLRLFGDVLHRVGGELESNRLF